MRSLVPITAAAAALVGGSALAQPSAVPRYRVLAAEVSAAERAFDARTAEAGFTAGFMEFAAPDGILFRPDPVNAREYLASRPVSTDTALRWGPYRIGMADSGDLAWDTGPWTYGDNEAHGWFFTVWERQSDGSWRWALDHGSGSSPEHVEVPPPGEEVLDTRGVAGPNAWAEVQALDQALGEHLGFGTWEYAYRDRLSDDAWVNTPDRGPAMTGEAVAQALAARPALSGYEFIGGGASEAGDLAYVYAHVRWTEGETPRRGHAIRVWRRDAPGPEGWRVVYDQLSLVPAG